MGVVPMTQSLQTEPDSLEVVMTSTSAGGQGLQVVVGVETQATMVVVVDQATNPVGAETEDNSAGFTLGVQPM